MKSVKKDEMKLALAEVGLEGVNSSMLSKCAGVANALHIQPKAIAECWEAFSLNKGIDSLTDHSWQSFRNELYKEADRNPNQTPSGDDDNHHGAVAVRKGMGKRQVGSPDEVGSALVTPPTKRQASGKNAGGGQSAVDAVAAAPTAPTPNSKAVNSNYTPPKYEDRTGAGKVMVTFNPKELPATSNTDSTSGKCGIAYNHFDTNIQKPYRHLFTTMDDRAKALDQHLVRLEDVLMERYNIGKDAATEDSMQDDNAIAPLEGVGVPRQDKICCIGRICNAAHEGRINTTSVVLEGSKHLGGARIEMDLTHLKEDKNTSFSLFPGQIIAVEGMNSTGRKMTAHRICEGAAHGTRKSTVKSLLQYHHSEDYQNGQPLKLMTVSGPYTTSDNLNYDPLYDFMHVVLQAEPDVVIMVGPFVDLRHPDIESGKASLQFDDGSGLTVPFEAFFANKIATVLEDFFAAKENLQTQFVLVPSLDDANAEWVYPQAPFQDRVFGDGGKFVKIAGGEDVTVGSLGLEALGGAKYTKNDNRPYRRIHCVSNPCTLQINELVVGVTGTDAIFHMSADETNANLVPGSRLTRIAQHMLQQQSYYPLFPPALGTNLDLKHMKQWNMPCQPDLLIVPSKLTSFARPVLGDTVVVNPGQLSKNTTGGTYAIMDVHPMKRDDLENAGGDDVEMDHNVADRIRVEVRKI